MVWNGFNGCVNTGADPETLLTEGGGSVYVKEVSEWVLLKANSTFVQLNHGENKLNINEMMMRSTL